MKVLTFTCFIFQRSKGFFNATVNLSLSLFFFVFVFPGNRVCQNQLNIFSQELVSSSFMLDVTEKITCIWQRNALYFTLCVETAYRNSSPEERSNCCLKMWYSYLEMLKGCENYFIRSRRAILRLHKMYYSGKEQLLNSL